MRRGLGMDNIIKKLRKQNGLTMRELAGKIGVSEGTISRWESGEIANMKRNHIATLAKVFNVPATDFLDLEDKVYQNKTPTMDSIMDDLEILYYEGRENIPEDKRRMLESIISTILKGDDK